MHKPFLLLHSGNMLGDSMSTHNENQRSKDYAFETLAMLEIGRVYYELLNTQEEDFGPQKKGCKGFC